MIGVYKFTNKYNRKVYVGQSVRIEKRRKEHIKAALCGEDTLFYRALRKYGPEGFDFDILIECPKENLNYWEKFYIRYYCSNNRDFGYNRTNGGDGVLGLKWSEESKNNRRQISLDYYQTHDAPFKDKHHSDDSKKLIGSYHKDVPAWNKGMVDIWTKEQLEQISNSLHVYYDNHPEVIKEKSEKRKGISPGNKGKHKVWNDDTHTKYHYE